MAFIQTPLPKTATSRSTETAQAFDHLNRARIKEFDERTARDRATPEIFAFESEKRRPATGGSIDELYYSPEWTSRELQTALRLLAEAINLAEVAIKELRSGRALGSHEATITIQSLMPELFACRGLGDGYGALINSIQLALINRHAVPLDENQLLALKSILESAREKPFIKFENARKLIREFERYDFVVEPATLQFLSTFFDE